MTEAEIQTSIEEHKTRNSELRNVFIRKGTALATNRDIECHFWAQNARDAANLAEALRARGFTILRQNHVPTEEATNLFNVEAGIAQSIETSLSSEFTSEMVRTANRYHSIYDGWGALV